MHSPTSPHRVKVEDIEWMDLLPGLRLVRSFRQAIHPVKLALALMLVVLLYFGGVALDFIWGTQIDPGQVQVFDPDSEGRLGQRVRLGRPDQPQGVFRTILEVELLAFSGLIESATSLDFGLRDFLRGKGLDSGGVIGALATMVVAVPAWFYQAHPGFLAVYLLYAYLLTAIFGGAIARLAALHACRDIRISPFAAVRFAARRYVWLVLAPIIPVAAAGLFIALPMALSGLAFFNLPATDVLGGVLFGFMLVGGLVIALMFIGLAAGINLLVPAIAVEGADAFDAIARSFYYVFGRPWRYLVYTAVFLVYGAVTYLFMGFVLYLTLRITKSVVGVWAFADASPGIDRFNAILPDPQWGHLVPRADLDALDVSGTLAAICVQIWHGLLVGLLPAFAISYYFCGQTWIYLLLRRISDGAEFEEVFVEGRTDESSGTEAASAQMSPAGQ